MSIPRPKITGRIKKLYQAGPDARFHIDYAWWDNSDVTLEAHVRNSLGGDVALDTSAESLDLIDPRTGEVHVVSGFEYTLQKMIKQSMGNSLGRLPLVDACFVVLLANGNRPMRASEIAEEVSRSPDVVFRALSGRVKLGIRPYLEV